MSRDHSLERCTCTFFVTTHAPPAALIIHGLQKGISDFRNFPFHKHFPEYLCKPFLLFLYSFSALVRKRIDLKSMLGVYVVMSVGLIVSFLGLMTEIVWKRRQQRGIISMVRRSVSVNTEHIP